MSDKASLPSKFINTLTSFSSGDDNSYPWSTRLPRGGDQFLQDLQAEWNLPNKSVTLRTVVLILYNYIDKLDGIEIGERIEDRLEYLRVRKEKQERDRMRAELYEMLLSAEREDHPPLKARLRLAAQKMSKRYGLPWPPPEVPLVQRDAEANYLLDRIMKIMQSQQINQVTLRELVRRTTFDAPEAREVIQRLEEAGCIETKEETRSGLPTLFVTIPTLEEAFAYSE